MLSSRKVVVTGLGIISPVGNRVPDAWKNIVAGVSGVSKVERIDVTDYPVQIAGQVKDFDASQVMSPKDARRMDTFIHYGMGASIEAVTDAKLTRDVADYDRVGVSIGSGIGGLPVIEKNCLDYAAGGVRKISPFFVPASIVNMVSGLLAIHYGFKGPNLSTVTACASANHSIGNAARMIAYGDADVMIAGGAESTICAMGLGGFASMKALSTRNDDPQAASRPWDKDRDGFVLGEGAGILVLEEYEHAKKRGAKIYCELAGFGMSADAYHMTAPAEDGNGAARCMAAAIKDAQIQPSDIDYINAHGTSTPLGDIGETLAIKTCFGEYASKVAISSTKSMTGHLLGAAGGIEAVFCVKAIEDGIAPPTINLKNQDPQCDLDYVPNQARKMKIDIALSNSFGFGGTNASLVFRKI